MIRTTRNRRNNRLVYNDDTDDINATSPTYPSGHMLVTVTTTTPLETIKLSLSGILGEQVTISWDDNDDPDDPRWSDGTYTNFTTAHLSSGIMDYTHTYQDVGTYHIRVYDGLEHLREIKIVNQPQVTELDITNAYNIQKLELEGLSIPTVDLTEHHDLRNISITNTSIEHLNISKAPVVEFVTLNNNPNLDVLHTHTEPNYNLHYLDISHCGFINVLAPSMLEFLYGLYTLDVSYNAITDIDFSHCSQLMDINLSYNNLSGIVTNNTILGYLENFPLEYYIKHINLLGNPNGQLREATQREYVAINWNAEAEVIMDPESTSFVLTVTQPTTIFKITHITDINMPSSVDQYIDWGDGHTTSYAINAGTDEVITHTYASTGTYTVKTCVQTLGDGSTTFDHITKFGIEADNDIRVTGINFEKYRLVDTIIMRDISLFNIDLTLFPNLTHVELQDNYLTEINISGLQQLTYLDVARNRINIFHSSDDKPNLTYVDLSDNGIINVGSMFDTPGSLTSVNIKNNKFEELPLMTPAYLNAANNVLTDNVITNIVHNYNVNSMSNITLDFSYNVGLCSITESLAFKTNTTNTYVGNSRYPDALEFRADDGATTLYFKAVGNTDGHVTIETGPVVDNPTDTTLYTISHDSITEIPLTNVTDNTYIRVYGMEFMELVGCDKLNTADGITFKESLGDYARSFYFVDSVVNSTSIANMMEKHNYFGKLEGLYFKNCDMAETIGGNIIHTITTSYYPNLQHLHIDNCGITHLQLDSNVTLYDVKIVNEPSFEKHRLNAVARQLLSNMNNNANAVDENGQPTLGPISLLTSAAPAEVRLDYPIDIGPNNTYLKFDYSGNPVIFDGVYNDLVNYNFNITPAGSIPDEQVIEFTVTNAVYNDRNATPSGWIRGSELIDSIIIDNDTSIYDGDGERDANGFFSTGVTAGDIIIDWGDGIIEVVSNIMQPYGARHTLSYDTSLPPDAEPVELTITLDPGDLPTHNYKDGKSIHKVSINVAAAVSNNYIVAMNLNQIKNLGFYGFNNELQNIQSFYTSEFKTDNGTYIIPPEMTNLKELEIPTSEVHSISNPGNISLSFLNVIACGNKVDIPQWFMGTNYSVGDVVRPTSYTGVNYKCTQAGVSGIATPDWYSASTVGSTVSDGGSGGVIWEAVEIYRVSISEYELYKIAEILRQMPDDAAATAWNNAKRVFEYAYVRLPEFVHTELTSPDKNWWLTGKFGNNVSADLNTDFHTDWEFDGFLPIPRILIETDNTSTLTIKAQATSQGNVVLNYRDGNFSEGNISSSVNTYTHEYDNTNHHKCEILGYDINCVETDCDNHWDYDNDAYVISEKHIAKKNLSNSIAAGVLGDITVLNLSNTGLTNLEIPPNSNLSSLDVSDNPGYTGTLDLSQCPSLNTGNVNSTNFGGTIIYA